MNMFKVLDQVLHIYAEFSFHSLIFNTLVSEAKSYFEML